MKTAFKIIALVLLVALTIGLIPVAGLLVFCGVSGHDASATGGGLILFLLAFGVLIGAINIVRSLRNHPDSEDPK